MIENTEKKTGFLHWFDNFWYHYKWHSIVAIFLVFTITVCSVQMCTKDNPDAYIMYAGNTVISKTNGEGGISPFQTATASLKKHAEDYNGDGEVYVAFNSLYILNEEEIKAIEDEGDYDIDRTYIQNNHNELTQMLSYGDYFIFILSTDLYLEFSAASELPLFTPLANYASSDSLSYAADDAVYLNSTKLATEPVFCDLPSDTVVCFRVRSEVALFKGNDAQYQNSEKILRDILSK
ncbi:MAG: hypothetical protein IJY65_01875 [Clostridia bacterium]|nr:hypothetical protein [Clostridia bacterium]